MKQRYLRNLIGVFAVALVLAASITASGTAGAHTGPAHPLVVE